MVSTIEANQIVHTTLINSGEYQRSPHRMHESVELTKTKIASLNLGKLNTIKHLDVGCGDGFMFECTPKGWDQYGVDATQAMLSACKTNHPTVKTKIGIAENLDFESETFDIITCYSFLDHLEDTNAFYSEAIRVLKPGGIFFFGLSPNRDFFLQLRNTNEFEFDKDFPEIDIKSELLKAFNDGEYYEKNFNIPSGVLSACEPGKTTAKGLSASEEVEKLYNLSVEKVNVSYEWVIQQNKLPAIDVSILKKYLPFTSGIFKYFDLWGRK